MKRRLLLVAILVAVCPHARAAVLCTGRTGSGTVRVREACRSSETQLDPDALGLHGIPGPTGATGAMGPPGATGPQGPRGSNVVVRDANGVFVGYIFGGLPTVLRSIDGRVVQLALDATGFLLQGGEFGDALAVYVSADCSGIPLVPNAPASGSGEEISPPRAQVNSATNLAYYRTGATVTRHAISVLRAGLYFPTNCSNAGGTFIQPNLCCLAIDYTGPTAEMTTFDLGTLGLVPPFHVDVQ